MTKTGWTKLNAGMPKAGEPVLACVGSGKCRTIIRAVWMPKYFEEDDGDNYDGESEYNQEKDRYYWPEGWYEWNERDETHWRVSQEVTHWMPLPGMPESEHQVCRVCGCTDTNACVTGSGEPCHWVEKDLCSACAGKLQNQSENCK